MTTIVLLLNRAPKSNESDQTTLLAEHDAPGVDPLPCYKRNVLATRNEILDLLQQLVDSERLADVAYMALQERDDPENGEAMELFVALLESLAEVTAEELTQVRKGLYDPSFIQPDMDYQGSLLKLTAYKEELSR